ncbi:MAG: NAD(P)H-dependent oxidoreductase subunit E, partial [Gammaproteobacteria bacterium]
QLEQHVIKSLGVEYHKITEDGLFSLEPVYCLGNCACTPSLMIDNKIYGRVTNEKFEYLVSRLRQKRDTDS